MDKVKIKLMLLTFCLALFLPICLSAAETEAEKWLAHVSETSNQCKNIGKDILGSHSITLVHKDESSIVIVVDKNGHQFGGKRIADKPKTYKLRSSYQEDAGIVSDYIVIIMEDEEYGSGHGIWNWTDGIMSCGGSYKISIKKQAD